MGQFAFWTDPYTSGTTTAQNNYATESFRQWALGVHNMILSAGFLEVAVSGSIGHGGPCGDFSASGGAVVGGFGFFQTGSGVNLFAGFKVYQFNDALQPVVPIFFKVGYGQGNNLAQPGFFIQAGTSHSDNPTGSIVGQASAQFSFYGTVPTQGDVWDWLVGGDATQSLDPYLVVVGAYADVTANTQGGLQGGSAWFIERTKDQFGAADNHGFVVGGCTNGTTWSTNTVPISGTVPGAENTRLQIAAGTTKANVQQSPTMNGGFVFYLAYPFHGISRNPLTSVMASNEQTMRDHDVIPAAIYSGHTHRYIKTRYGGVRNTLDTAVVAFMRWS